MRVISAAALPFRMLGPDLVVEEVSVVLCEEGKQSREDGREVFAAGG